MGTLFGELSWVADGITEVEQRGLQYIEEIHQENPSPGGAFITLPWVTNGIVADERWALQYLRDFQVQDLTLGAEMLRRPWVIDGITNEEQWSLRYISEIHKANAVLGVSLANLPWALDSITEDERWAYQYLQDFQAQDPALGSAMIQRPWVTDGITEQEQWALLHISEIHGADSVLGASLANLSWAKDDIAADERWALRFLKDLHTEYPALASQLASMPFFTESITRLDVDTLASINNLRVNHPKILEQLLEQDWYLDGLDQLEAALVMMVGARGGATLGPDDLRGFLIRHHAESRVVDLPLAGAVELIFVQSAQNKLNDDIVDQVEDAIRVLEDFMSTPFPISEVVLLMATPGELSGDFDVAGLNYGTHMIIDPSLARQGDNNRVLNHEVAHYYWGVNEAPQWFYEGGSDFLSSYIRDQLYDDPLVSRAQFVEIRELRYCTAMSTIQKLIDDLERQGFAQHSAMPYFFCNYSRGQDPLLTLYFDIGSDAVRAAMAEIYQIAATKGRPATEAEIYLAFLDQTTPENSAGFKETYLKRHGGDLPEG